MDLITDLGPFTVDTSNGTAKVLGARGGVVVYVGSVERFAAVRIAEAVAATLNNERLHDGQSVA